MDEVFEGPGSTRQSRGKVLVVDDDESVRVAIKRALTSARFEVTTAESSEKAIALITSTVFDVIVSDIHMPKLSGIQLLRMIRMRDLDVPVVLMTGQPELSTATQAIALGALQYLTKPVRMAELKTTVQRAARLNYIGRLKREAFVLTHGEDAKPYALDLMEARLDRALDSLWMAYQPIVHAESGSVFAYEALLRASEPTLPNPGAVLDAATRLGRLSDVGRKVRATVATTITHAPLDALFFVNIHPHDLLDAELYSSTAPLTQFASRVVLEITERAALHDSNDVRDRAATLRSMGYRLAIDDLGAGFAGLTSFASLEPEIVKIDLSLVRDVDTNPLKQKLIGALVQVSRELEILVVSEGVETTAERDALIALGCPLLQGYLIGRPAAALAGVTAG